MSDVTTHERPGVYSTFTASSLINGSSGVKTVAVVAQWVGVGKTYYEITAYSEAVSTFGGSEEITELCRLVLLGGAAKVIAVPISGQNGYEAGFAVTAGLEEVEIVICDNTLLTVQQALMASVESCSAERMERIAVVAGGANETVAALVARAAGLNSERVVLVAPSVVNVVGTVLSGVRGAAAVAGAIAGEGDPAIPLSGAVLSGLSGLEKRYTDSEIDLLVRGGVTALESAGGEISVVRGVTTRTKTGGVRDETWLELTTILIVDDVIPGLRDTLRAKFQRTKNTEQNRGAIRTQVILELEEKLDKEIITEYGDVTVTALEENPTVCLVQFSFTVTHGLNQIWLKANITV
jgi:phage tail sheath gpL-like